jgi:hypothetical protein
MDFEMLATAAGYHKRLTDFLIEHVVPAETSYEEYRLKAGSDDHTVPSVVEDLKVLAKQIYSFPRCLASPTSTQCACSTDPTKSTCAPSPEPNSARKIRPGCRGLLTADAPISDR